MTGRRAARAVAVLVAGLVTAAGCSLPGRVSGPVEVIVDFDDVNDLVVNHAVQVADVRVGSVTSITLTEDLRRAHITMHIQDGLELPADSVAVLRQTSLLGEKFIEIRPRREGDCPGVDHVEGEIVDEAVLPCSIQAPELEAVTEEAVQLLGAVITDDLQTLIEAGSVGFGGRGEELRSIIEDLSSVSATLASQTGNIVSIIDGLDAAAGVLAAGSADLDGLLLNLADATTVLADNRDEAISALEALTRLARDQNQLIFQPHLDATSRQIQELDAILAQVSAGRAEVGNLLDFLFQFIDAVPLSIPCDQVGQEATDAQPDCTSGGDFAQVYGWFVPVLTPDGAP
jgi:phospholipid/cholesterol/gamma-HCH transport system substrate-binding protein